MGKAFEFRPSDRMVIPARCEKTLAERWGDEIRQQVKGGTMRKAGTLFDGRSGENSTRHKAALRANAKRREQIIAFLRQNPHSRIGAIADGVGLPVGNTRYLMKRFSSSGDIFKTCLSTGGCTWEAAE